VGFDWNNAKVVLEKIRGKTEELEAALDSGKPVAVEGEIGDLLFAVANISRHAHIDPEAAVRSANAFGTWQSERKLNLARACSARAGDHYLSQRLWRPVSFRDESPQLR
jgi:uncharacterized protein YabN with tetrapyrrole methylase and pyrophosphatase domain